MKTCLSMSAHFGSICLLIFGSSIHCTSFLPLTNSSVDFLSQLSGLSGSHFAFSPQNDQWAVANEQQVFILNREEIKQTFASPQLLPAALAWQSSDRLRVGIYEVSLGEDLPQRWLEPNDLISQQDNHTWAVPVKARLLASQWAADGSSMLLQLAYEPKGRGRERLSVGQGPVAQLFLLEPDAQPLLLANLDDQQALPLTLTSTYAAWGGEALHIWSRETRSFFPSSPEFTYPITQLADFPAQAALLCGQADGKMVVWSLLGQKKIAAWQAHSDRLTALAAHRTQALFCTAGDGEGWKLWDFSGSEPSLRHTESSESWIDGLAFLPKQNELLVSNRDPESVLFRFRY